MNKIGLLNFIIVCIVLTNTIPNINSQQRINSLKTSTYEAVLDKITSYTDCPTVTNQSTEIESLCEGDVPDFATAESSIVFSDPNGQANGISWYLDVNLDNVLNTGTYTLPHSGNCESETIVLYAGVNCSSSEDPIAAGQITVTVYPEPTSVTSVGGCSLEVTDNCTVGSLIIQYSDDDGDTWGAVPNSNPTEGEEIAWRAFVSGTPDNDGDESPDCLQTGVVTASCTGCPTVGTSAATIESLCEGDVPDFGFAESSIVFSDPNGQSEGIEWFTDVSLSNELNTGTYALPHSGNCESETIVLYAGLNCSSSEDPIAVGQITVTVYPEPTSVAPVGGCSLAVVDNCIVGSLIIQYSDDGGETWGAVPNSNPTEGEEIAWRAFVSGTPDNDNDGNPDCFQTGVVIASCTGCPTVTNQSIEIESLCEGDVPDFMTAESSIVFNDQNGQSEGIKWFLDVNRTDAINTVTYTLPHSGTCESETIVLYAGLNCSSGNPIAAGRITVFVYPEPTNVAPVGGCSLEVIDNCIVGSLIVQYSDDDGETWGVVPNSNPTQGEQIDWRAFVSGTPDNDSDGNPDCFQKGAITASCTGCPIVTNNSNEVESLCEGGVPDFTTAESSIVFNDPNGQSEGIKWFLDVNRTDAINTVTYTLPHSGTCESETLVLYAGLKCSSIGASIAAGKITVTVYPEPTSVALVGGCSLEVIDNCTVGSLIIQYSDDGGVTWDAVPNSNPTEGEEITWRGFVSGTPDNDSDENPDCLQTGVVIASCTGCPTVGTSAAAIESLCEGDLPDFMTAESSIVFSDPNGQANGIGWFSNVNRTKTINTETYTLPHSGACGSETIVLYAGVKCESGTPIAAGQITVTVYPEPTSVAPVGGCSLEVIDNCTVGSLIVQYSDDGGVTWGAVPNSNPTEGEEIAWRAFVSGTPDNDGEESPDCLQTGVVTASCTGCPTVGTSAATIESLCEGDVPDFMTAESSIVFSDPNGQSEGIGWFSDVSRTDTINTETYTLPHSGACGSETIVLYAGVKCESGTPIAAGQITVYVYPEPTSVASIGGCSLLIEDNCTVRSLIIQYSDDDGDTWGAVPNSNPTEGEEIDWRAFVSGTPDNDDDGNPDCVQMGTVKAEGCTDCPTVEELVEIKNETQHCFNDVVNFNYELNIGSDGKKELQFDVGNDSTKIVFRDPNNLFQGVKWYEDFDLTVEISENFNDYHSGGCQIFYGTLYAGIICSEEGSEPTLAGQMNVIVYPNPLDAIESEVLNDCNLDIQVKSECGENAYSFGVEYKDTIGNPTNENSILYPYSGDELEWRAYVVKENQDTCYSSSKISTADNCPEEDCPYPVIQIQEGTNPEGNLTDFSPPQGPIVLLCTFPSIVNEEIDLSKVGYRWGYRDNNRNFMPLDGSIRNTYNSFYVVTEHDRDLLNNDIRNYGVQVRTYDSNDCSSTSFYKVIGKNELGENVSENVDIQLLPNPNQGNFKVSIQHPDYTGTVQLKCYNSMGKLEETSFFFKEENTLIADIKGLTIHKGIYFLEILLGNQERIRRKLIIY